MWRREYVIALCAKLSEAAPVAQKRVKFRNGDEPGSNTCHENVERWVREHPECASVRGWLVSGLILDAHSVLAEPSGSLFDITPLSIGGLPFLRHCGSEGEFWAVAQHSPQINCVLYQSRGTRGEYGELPDSLT